ncbi:MAG TPA: sigma-70 family RNA polymerase sigma factor [Pirellulales bacterium]|nr:sigma-70 family RNA polymerase sigma factor [Pirellulales bacterium]
MPAATGWFDQYAGVAMTAHNPVSEAELEAVFENDPDFGVEALFEDYGETVFRYIKKHGWGLQHADWLDVLQQTMLELTVKARSPGFDHRKPLSIVFTIASRRIKDKLRRKKHQPNSDPDAILDYVAKDYAGSEFAMKWKYADNIHWEDFRQALHEIIATLPGKQLIVARVFVDNYEDFRERDTYGPLAELVSKVTGEAETVAGVKSAWHEAKAKIVRELTRRGFNFFETE